MEWRFPFSITFGKMVKIFLIERDATQKELALALGISRSTLYRWFRGALPQDLPLEEDVRQIAQILQLSQEEEEMLLATVGYGPRVPIAPA